MNAASLILLVALAAQPANAAQPTRTTPYEILTACCYNDAKVDATLTNQVVDVRSRVASIDRDGAGGYVVRLEAHLQTNQMIAHANVLCYFGSKARDDLARIRPGRDVVIRGVVSKIDDDTRRNVDARVQVTMRSCELIALAE